MSTLTLFLTWVIPLVLVGVTVGLWSILIVLQSPRPYWRDSLNISLGGILGLFAIYVLEEAGGYAGLWERAPIDIRILVLAAGAFATLGLPRTVAELRLAIERRVGERQERTHDTEVSR